jgi:hypothetical protein
MLPPTQATGAPEACSSYHKLQAVGMSPSRFPLAMDPSHTETIDCQEESLRKMSIAFLTSNEPSVKGTERRTAFNGEGDSTNDCFHQQNYSILPTYGVHHGDRLSRVERWVASQSSTLANGYNSGYAVHSEDGILCDRGQWPGDWLNKHVGVTSTLESITSPDQQGVDAGKVPLADTELALLRSFTSPTPKRSRSPRLFYTKEEKLFIMHSRVIGDVSWQDISKTFEIIFGKRNTKHMISGLRGTYYRTRREWGMDYVTRSGPSERRSDQMVVSAKLREYAGRPSSFRAASQACGEDINTWN